MRLEKLSSEEKVNLAINMVDVSVRICADGIRAQNRNIAKEELLEELRERISYGKRLQRF